MNTEDMRYARYIVDRYLTLHPAFVPLRDDLISIASEAYAIEKYKWDPSKSNTPFLVHMRIRVQYRLGSYIRDKNPMKHFQREATDSESPYWDIEDIPEVESLPDTKEDNLRKLKEVLLGVPLTDHQEQVLRMFLEGLTFKEIGGNLKLAPQTVYETYQGIIKKVRKANELE